MVLMFETIRGPDRSGSRAVCGPQAALCPSLVKEVFLKLGCYSFFLKKRKAIKFFLHTSLEKQTI